MSGNKCEFKCFMPSDVLQLERGQCWIEGLTKVVAQEYLEQGTGHTEGHARKNVNQAERRAALHVSGSAARQEVLVPLCDGLLQGDISGHLLRLGLEQGLLLGVRHLDLFRSALGWGECRCVVQSSPGGPR